MTPYKNRNRNRNQNRNSLEIGNINQNNVGVRYINQNNARGVYLRRRSDIGPTSDKHVKSLFNMYGMNSPGRTNKHSLSNNRRKNLNDRLDVVIDMAKDAMVYVHKKHPRFKDSGRYRFLRRTRETAKEYRKKPNVNTYIIEGTIRSLYNSIRGMRNNLNLSGNKFPSRKLFKKRR